MPRSPGIVFQPAEPTPRGQEGPGSAADEARREDVRTWLQMVKAVLPLEREANRLFARGFGQSLPRFDVLAQLDLEGEAGLPVGTLAERLIASAGNITHLISRMEREGLVARATDPGDRRSQLVRATPEGRAVYERMALAHDDWVSERLGSLSAAEKQTLKALLRKLRTGATDS